MTTEEMIKKLDSVNILSHFLFILFIEFIMVTLANKIIYGLARVAQWLSNDP